jgi:hypothetical protein
MINAEVHHIFFHQFIIVGSNICIKFMFTCHGHRKNKTPSCMMGYPGCIGSTDATHVMLLLRNAHID